MAQQNKGVDLRSLPLDKLQMVGKSLEQDLENLTASYSGLSVAAAKFRTSRASLEAINDDNQGKDVLLPLTTSMYVPGKLADVSKVMVDVGTGYYVEKSIPDAQAFFDRKLEFLKSQSEAVEKQIATKNQQYRVLRQIAGEAQAKAEAEARATAGASSSS
ncbi:prefoldin, alpha subunit [Thecamonas trahens ATCC 50062]|uniref:Prefoldin, alpha subunit n=1 Tax=Thecamonas trahens ATCC 50062 TaxID=461836 RepID=A0A0L0DSI6_THETB|nr:prefoldin, alpha subunit [Thecamonas trahens ATCC 50062]KNC55309.1 prefoldin, alpha subunit [Thecamonas trahens ATCC 50062]|eukprot:XP_013753129.1 prefoldin, alpha subunit [Thecamonas trahens ATCC 50062]